MTYLHLFESESDFNAEYNGLDYTEPGVSLTKSVERVDYNNKTYDPYPNTYFTIESLGSGYITGSYVVGSSIQYSKNGGEGIQPSSSVEIPVVAGDRVSFKGTNSTYHNNGGLKCSASFNVFGNIMSLIAGDNFITADSFSENYVFAEFFKGANTLISAENLKLPVNSMTENCYYQMFYNCTNLTTAPELPATTLERACYASMFGNCSSLVAAPVLPATTLSTYCYSFMFYGCSSLTTAPEIPATTLLTQCCTGMFQNCTNLNYIKAMFTTTPNSNYTSEWVSGVASTGTFVKNAEATGNVEGVNGVPTGGTIQTASE